MPAGLIAETMPHETVDDQGDEQSRGDTPRPRGRRGRRVPTGGKISGRKFQVPDLIFERLQLTAIRKRSNPSAVLSDILDRNLPRWRIEQEA